MTNGIHNKTAKGLTHGCAQQHFSHIFLGQNIQRKGLLKEKGSEK